MYCFRAHNHQTKESAEACDAKFLNLSSGKAGWNIRIKADPLLKTLVVEEEIMPGAWRVVWQGDSSEAYIELRNVKFRGISDPYGPTPIDVEGMTWNP